jgi:hypothetical protein
MKSARLSLLIYLLVSGAGSYCHAQTYLTGEISGIYSIGEYVITGNIYVLPKTTLTFEAGSILRFENFTGIVVRGELICKGTPQQPISFTSSRDIKSSQSKPEAFDWNGIKVTPEATGLALEYCTIAYSTFGITIESSSTPVSIKEISFHNTGSASMTRERKMMMISENMPISFTWPEQSSNMSSTTSNTPSSTTNTKVNFTVTDSATHPTQHSTPVKSGQWKKGTRITTGSIAVLGGIMAITGQFLYAYYDDKYSNLNDPNQGDMKKSFRQNRYNSGVVRGIGLGVLGIGAAGFAITFFF